MRKTNLTSINRSIDLDGSIDPDQDQIDRKN